MAYTHITKEGNPIKMSDRTKKTLDHVEASNKKQKEKVKRDRNNTIEEWADKELYNIKSRNQNSVFISKNPISKNTF